MAALPYMPLFVADYLADTAHLTTIQHGAYLLLIMNYWQRGKPVANDDAKLARIVGMSVRNWQQIKEPVLEMFDTGTDSGPQYLHHHRIDRELDRVAAKSLKCKKAALANDKRTLSKRSTDAERTHSHTQAHTDTSSEPNGSAVAMIDCEAVMWRQGRLYLQSQGVSEQRASQMLGKWKKESGPEAVIVALGKAQREGAIDPISFVTGCLKPKGGRGYDPHVVTV